MAIKLLGSLLIVMGGAMGWFLQQAERRRKRDTLSGLLTALRRMGEAVRMARTPLPLLLERLGADCGPEAAAFFQGAAEAARRGEDFPEDWRRLAEALPLNGGNISLLANLGKDLQGDEEKVCKSVSLVCGQLEKSAEAAEQKRPEEEKRSTALWFSAAALLVILLI